MSFFEKQAEKLSEITEIPQDEIIADLTNKAKEGYSEDGALMVWKSQHKSLLSAGEAKVYTGRVIGKSDVREGNYGKYAFAGVLVMSEGVLEVKQISFSDASLDKMELMKFNGVYEFKAFEKGDGSLTRVRAIVEADDGKIPKVCELRSYEFGFPLLNDLRRLVGTTQLLHGWVGRLIPSKDTGRTIGFEFGDAETIIPITSWAHLPDEADKLLQSIEEGDEVYQYSYLNVNNDGDVTANMSGVFKA